ncbi:MAG: methionyl-tRNA formyltransferase [Candidatus Muiribacteriota bacterium]
MKIVFMGTPEYCLPALRSVFKKHELALIVTQPDKKSNRGHKVHFNPVKKFACKNNITCVQPEKIKKNSDLVNTLKKIAPEVILVIAYGKILPSSILNIPSCGCVNIHGSLLPELRGAAPIQYAIMRGYEKTGVTSILMNSKMDEGNMLVKKECEVKKDDNAGTLHDRLSILSADCALETLDNIEKNTVNPLPQNHAMATYTKIIKKSDGIINWGMNARNIYNHFRAMIPWPGAQTYMKKKYIKILDMEIINKDIKYKEAGKIIKADKNGLEVASGEGSLIIKKLQLPGKKPAEAGLLLNGYKWLGKGNTFDF